MKTIRTEERRAYERKWASENRDKVNAKRRKWIATKPGVKNILSEKTKRWRNKNREHVRNGTREQMRRWRAENREQVNADAREAKRKWRIENPELARHKDSCKYAERKGAKGTCTLEQWMARVEFYGWRCFYCTTQLTRKTLTRDHRIAIKNGGTNFASNLVPACVHCNCSKRHSQLPLD
jgi:5-methylcytosine-specific restriction endonuclease McrA